MLSPAAYHTSIPRSTLDNLKFRKHTLRKAADDPEMQSALYVACRDDILFFVNMFVWQFNPRVKGREVGPFITWKYQDDAFLAIVNCIEEDVDLVIEKSREMGASWMVLIVYLWLTLFHPYKAFLVMSRNEDAVDKKGDPQSLYWKIDFMMDHLPHYLLPRGFRKRLHRKDMFLENIENGSTITGQASTGKAGVGGRATSMLIDEFSQIKEDYQVLGRTADTTGSRIFTFTHNGLGTAAFELSQRVDIRKINMHWSQHPMKNRGLYHYDREKRRIVQHDRFQFPPEYRFVTDGSPTGGPFPGLRSPWYDNECRRRKDPRAIAMDLDIDPKGSTSQFFDPLTINDLIHTYSCDPLWEGELDYDLQTAKPVGLVKHPGGKIKLWMNPLFTGKIPPARYCSGADVSTGMGATNSCFSLGNADTGEKVVEVATPHMNEEDFGTLCVALCWLFKDGEGNGATFCWEGNGPGNMLGKRVMELGYSNIYWRTNEFKEIGPKRAETPGWAPTNQNKRLLLEQYRNALSTRRILNRSADSLKETLAFAYVGRGDVEHTGSKKANDPSGAGVNHGDRVIADALMWKMMSERGVVARIEDDNKPKFFSLAWRVALHEQQESEKEAWY